MKISLFCLAYRVSAKQKHEQQQSVHDDKGGRDKLHKGEHQLCNEHDANKNTSDSCQVNGSTAFRETNTKTGGQRQERRNATNDG